MGENSVVPSMYAHVNLEVGVGRMGENTSSYAHVNLEVGVGRMGEKIPVGMHTSI